VKNAEFLNEFFCENYFYLYLECIFLLSLSGLGHFFDLRTEKKRRRVTEKTVQERKVLRWGGTQFMEDERTEDESKPRICLLLYVFLCGMKCFKKELGFKDAYILLD